jgi:uncharacterized protein YkwD
MRPFRPLQAAALTALALAVTPAAAAGSAGTDMLSAINSARAARGVGPVGLSYTVSRGAYGWARHIVEADQFDHASWVYTAAGYRKRGEVIEMHAGVAPFAVRTVSAWLASPTHRAVLLDPAYRYVGVGLAGGYYHGRRTEVWVGRFVA